MTSLTRCFIVAATTLFCSLPLSAAQVTPQPKAALGHDEPPADRPTPRTDRNSAIAHAELLEKRTKGRIDVYFLGDSITRRWGATDYPQLLANWKANFHGWNAANFGWGADRIENILWRLENGELGGVHPRVIVIHAGANNVGARPGGATKIANITRGLRALVETCRRKAPEATIVLTAIFPRNDNMAVVSEINAINGNLARLAAGSQIRFVNVNHKLADRDGRLFDGMMNADGLHPAINGYQVWADALKPILEEILGPPASTDHAPPPTGDPSARAQQSALPPPSLPEKGWTTEEDHRHMMDQLGIQKLRPGPSGNEQAPNHANYDEALANPFPDLPDALTLKNGKKVSSAEVWWKERRPEILEDFEREVYGRVPKNAPPVTWTVADTVKADIAGRQVVGKRVVGRVDNSSHPAINVEIPLILVRPADVAGPVPVMIMFRRGGLPGEPLPEPRSRLPPGAEGNDPPATEQLIAAGWGYAFLNPFTVQEDNGAGLTKGIIGLVNKGQPRKPDDWGALRAWAWGASRALDYLETDRAIDAKRVGIEGVSRFGKAALVTMAFDARFAVVLVGSSGEGGAKLHRRNFGEAVENLTGSGEYHWMAGNFLKYGAEEASFGRKNAGDLPVDAHQLIALCAPRLTFISYGVPEKGDAKWLDQQGSYMAAVAAGPVFRLLGARDLGTSDDYRTEKMPAVNVGLLEGHLAWRQHDGGHTDAPNWKYFIPWADRLLKPGVGMNFGNRDRKL